MARPLLVSFLIGFGIVLAGGGSWPAALLGGAGFAIAGLIMIPRAADERSGRRLHP